MLVFFIWLNCGVILIFFGKEDVNFEFIMVNVVKCGGKLKEKDVFFFIGIRLILCEDN